MHSSMQRSTHSLLYILASFLQTTYSVLVNPISISTSTPIPRRSRCPHLARDRGCYLGCSFLFLRAFVRISEAFPELAYYKLVLCSEIVVHNPNLDCLDPLPSLSIRIHAECERGIILLLLPHIAQLKGEVVVLHLSLRDIDLEPARLEHARVLGAFTLIILVHVEHVGDDFHRAHLPAAFALLTQHLALLGHGGQRLDFPVFVVDSPIHHLVE
mmetsp:Transcript_24283/g.43049  ORF Transcript_24283/g.43049 Transcript_24283/m.43049 type:complete len:214 (+) Transcript_24283:107-748(+)